METINKKQVNDWLNRQKKKSNKLKLSLFCGCVNGCLSVAQAAILAQLLYRLIHLEQTRQTLIPFFIGFLAMTLLKLTALWAREQFAYQGATQIRSQIRQDLLEQIRKLGPAYIQQKATGEWATMAFEQVEQLHDYYAKYIPQMTIAVFTPLLILVILFPINWGIALILLCSVPLVPIIMAVSGIKAGKANEQNLEAMHRLSAQFYDRLTHLTTLKLFNRIDVEAQTLYENSENFRLKTMQVLRLAFISSAALEFFVALSIAVVAIYFGFTLSGHWHWGSYGVTVTLATALFVFLLAPEFYQPLRDLGNFYHAKSSASASANSLMRFLAQSHSSVNQQINETNGTEIAKIDFNNMTIEAKELVVLSASGSHLAGPLTFNIATHEHLAIMGKSGSGKTSLMQTLLGFLPYQGSLKINGIELNQIPLSQWHQQISWVDQNPFTLHSTIKENICLGHDSEKQQQDLKLVQICELASVNEFLPLLPNGLDQIIGEQGAGLSLGQIQRICLARALYKGGNLWLLDEPTASLDPHSQRLIEHSLQHACLDKTMIMVTHQPKQAQQADRTLVIEKGMIIDEISKEQWLDPIIQQRYLLNESDEFTRSFSPLKTEINTTEYVATKEKNREVLL